MYILRVTKEFGRGLYSTRTIMPGETIMQCELLVLSPLDTKTINLTDLKYYTFTFNAAQDCLVLGDAEIFNHYRKNNVDFCLKQLNDRQVMVFTANREIKSGEQLFIDYESDADVKANEYRINLVG